MADTRPLGGYLRISDADLADIRRAVRTGELTAEEGQEKERKGVLKQKEDVIRLAANLYPGQTVIFYEDNNLSAFKRNVVRKRFEQMLTDLETGSLGGVLAYDIDRLFRQPKDLERLIDHYDKPGSTLVFHTLSGQNFDLTQPDGRFTARIMVNVANKSSEDQSRRLKREREREAKAGEIHGGPRAFGWLEDKKTLHPQEAPALRTMSQMIIDGDSVTTCTRWLGEQGFLAKSGRPYIRPSVLRILRNPRNCGIVVFRKEILKDDEGNFVVGKWEPIIPVETWRAVTAVLDKRLEENRGKYGTHDYSLRSILSGVLRCGDCGSRMTASGSTKKRYKCSREAGGCGNVTISRPPVEEAVKGLVTDVLLKNSAEKEAEKEQPQWERAEELALLEQEFVELHDLWKSEKIKTTTYVIGREELEGKIDRLKGERAVTLARPTQKFTHDVIKDGWDNLSVERARSVILSVLSAVMVAKGQSNGHRTIDHGRLTPVFKEQ
ncbi:recombinase family protein [Streptomyces sp. NPDC058369]|uniref:recombinase family protein n=1 Tax=Streptomyces sp. NPDC058369 TaxID=3346462 RepID=UPI00365E9CE0